MAEGAKAIRLQLRQAALKLYRDQGFEGTTAAQIAARAGVTGRTFFRHFADKREVLFEEEALRATLVAGLTAAPADLPPLDALRRAFGSAESLLEENRPTADLRREIIAATPALQERALAKAAALAGALAAVLRLRGVEHRLASIAAQIGMVACSEAAAAWDIDPSRPFIDHLDRAFSDVRNLAGSA